MNVLACSFIGIFISLNGFAQTDSLSYHHGHIVKQNPIDSSKQKDIIDIAQKLFNPKVSHDKRKVAKKFIFSVVPSVGYTLTTGFAADLTGNVAFYMSKEHTENLSSVDADVSYNSMNQKIFISRSNVWAQNNKYNLVTDLRWEREPQNTWGLGTFSTNKQADPIDFDFIKVYATLYRRLFGDFFAGAGYNLNYHYNITESGNLDKSLSDFKNYGEYPQSTSSGLNVDFLYDSRRNSLNPLGGGLFSITYRKNFTFLGSNSPWQSLLVDSRKYIKLSSRSNNILAFWSILWFTNGNVPYLDLPGTGNDAYNNSGRGYAEGRFRGENMLYLEAEYRFGITSNGLIGGVVFANAESLSEFPGNSFKRIAPGFGPGIRIKVNKHSDTNICIDYGIGVSGSRGFFVNLGEVF
jgi:hypothetical protein